MPLSAAERAQIRERLGVILAQLDDRIAIREGIRDGLVLPDEFKFATGLEDTAPETMRRLGVEPVGSLAQHVRYRRELREQPAPGMREKFEAMQAESVRGVVETGTGALSYLQQLVEPVTRVTLDPLADVLTGHAPRIRDRRNEMAQGWQELNDDALNFFGVGAGPDAETAQFEALQRAIAGAPNNLWLWNLGGELIALGLTQYVGGAATTAGRLQRLERATRLAGGASLGLRGAADLAPLAISETGVLARAAPLALGVTEAGKLAPSARGLTALLAGPGLGITAALWTAPDDASAMELVDRAALGAGFGYLGAAALLGRPYGAIAREAFLAESRLSAAVGATADAAASSGLNLATQLGARGTISGLERFGLRQALRRGTFRFINSLAYSPRTTVGQMLGAGALGASYETGRAINDGESPNDAITRGVLTGGAWMGFDWMATRLGGIQRTLRLQGLWTQNAQNWLRSLGLSPGAAENLSNAAVLGQRAAIGGTAGAAVAGEDNRGTGAAIGAATALLLLPRVRAHLHSFLPRDTVAKVIEGNWGALTRDEAGSVAETLLSGISAQTARESRNPVYQALHDVLVGQQGTFQPRGLLAEVAGPSRRGFVLATEDTAVRVTPGQRGRAMSRAELLGRALPPNAGPSRRGETIPLPATFERQPLAERRLALPAPRTVVEGAIQIPGPNAAKLRTELEFVERNIKDLRAQQRKTKVTLKGLDAAVARQREIKKQLATLPARNEGIVSLPAATDTLTSEYVAQIKARQAELLAQLNVLESQGRPPLDPEVLGLAREYGALREQYANVLTRGGLDNPRANAAARETFNVATGKPGENPLTRGVEDAAEHVAGRKARLDAGFQTTEALVQTGAGVAGALAGAALGPYIGSLIRDDERGKGVDSVLGATVLGGIAAIAAGLVARGLASREAKSILGIIGVTVPKTLTRLDVATQLGKAGMKLKDTFAKLPVGVQVEHLMGRVENIASQANVAAKDKRAHLLAALNAFTPDALPVGLYEQFAAQWRAAASAAGFTSDQSIAAWRGFLANFTVPRERRVFGKAADLFALGRSVGPLADAKTWDELREVFKAAEAISGPINTATRLDSKVLDEMRRAAVVSKEAQSLRTYMDELDLGAEAASGVATGGIPRTFGGIRSIESIRRNAITLIENGNPIGRVILDVHDHIAAAVREIEREHDIAIKELNTTLNNFTSDQLTKMRLVIEGGAGKTAAEWRAAFAGHNDKLLTAADKFSGQLRYWANRLQIPEDMLIEDYLPWYYSQATIRELRALTPGARRDIPLTMGYGSGHPSHKVFRSALPRTRTEPLAGRITDLHELGQIYLYGAIRKYYLDQMLTLVQPDDIAKIARSGQRSIAADLQRLILDLHGIPSENAMRLETFITGLGLRLERLPMFERTALGRDIIDSFSDAGRLAGLVRGWEFYSKIGFNFTSPLVNLTQLVINTGTETSFTSIAAGVIDATRVGGAIFGETRPGKALTFLHPMIGPESRGADLLRVIRDQGTLSNRFLKTLEREADIAAGSFKPRGIRVGAAAAGALIGVATPSDDVPARTRAAAGAAAGALAGHFAPRYVARGLRAVRIAATGLFDSVEVFNRAASFSAFEREGRRALKLGREGATGKVGDVARGAVFGAATGGVIAAGFAEEGFDITSPEAQAGAIAGAVLGAGGAALGEARAARIGRQIEQFGLKERRVGILRPNQLAEEIARLGPPSEQEVAREYARIMTEITQFRFGRASRGALLRTPLGEAIGSLQTYTLNQIEFTGQRMEQFMRSVTRDLNTGQLRGEAQSAAGQLDLRIFRHAALIMAAGSALSAVSIGLDSNRGPEYWVNRIGWGFMPFVRYSERSNTWAVMDPGEAFAGPFISDLYSIVSTFWRFFDPRAAIAFDESLDNLSNDLVTMLRQAESNSQGLATIFEKFGQEGLADLLREQQAARRVARPFSTIRRGTPVARGAQGGGGADPFGGAAGQSDPFGGGL